MRLPKLLAFAVVLAAMSTACTTTPGPGGTTSVPPTIAPTPFTCDTPGSNVVVFGGDSLVVQWPQYLALPPGTVSYNTARAATGFGAPVTVNPADSSNIGQRVLAQLDACNNDVGLVVIGGGVNNLAGGQPLAPLLTEVAALSAQLAARNVAVLWIPITPWVLYTSPGAPVVPSLLYDGRYDNRLAYNTWLATPGNVIGAAPNCNSTLADPNNGRESLDPIYYSWLGLWQPDRYHPLKPTGYQAFTACLSPVVASYLPGGAPITP